MQLVIDWRSHTCLQCVKFVFAPQKISLAPFSGENALWTDVWIFAWQTYRPCSLVHAIKSLAKDQVIAWQSPKQFPAPCARNQLPGKVPINSLLPCARNQLPGKGPIDSLLLVHAINRLAKAQSIPCSLVHAINCLAKSQAIPCSLCTQSIARQRPCFLVHAINCVSD